MSNQWKKFKPDVDFNKNSALTGGKYIGLGTHEVRIEDIEQKDMKDGGVYYTIHYANADGQVFMDSLFPLSGKNGEKSFSFKYNSLAYALTTDSVLRFEFFTCKESHLANNPDCWKGLVGLYLNIEVTPGRKGYTIKGVDTDLQLVDIVTGDEVVLMGGIPNKFETYQEAHECAKAQGLYRAWNEVSKFHAIEGHQETNAKVIASLQLAANTGT